MKLVQKIVWPLGAMLVVLVTLLVCAPAFLLGSWLESQTDGRFVLGDVQGSLWHGSAFIGVASSDNGDLTPLLPGRFEWHLSPIILLGQIDVDLDNPRSLHNTLHLTGNLHQLEVSPDGLTLPSERLSGLGAPLNTLRPAGEIVVSWDQMTLELNDQQIEVSGAMRINLTEMSSALSPVKPLGSYLMKLDWHGHAAGLELSTVQGPLLLTGTGVWNQNRLEFSGQAEAQDGQEDKLANLLNLLGQRKPGADKNVIALEFK